MNTVLNLFHLSSISFAARPLVFPLKQNGIAKKKVFFSDSEQHIVFDLTVHMHGFIYSAASHRV